MKLLLSFIRHLAVNSLAFALVLSISACGGGAAADGSAPLSSAAGTLMKALDATSSNAAWTACATEGQYCAFSGSQQVRYGTATQFVLLTLTDGTACTNAA